jgi:hypothetical protein
MPQYIDIMNDKSYFLYKNRDRFSTIVYFFREWSFFVDNREYIISLAIDKVNNEIIVYDGYITIQNLKSKEVIELYERLSIQTLHEIANAIKPEWISDIIQSKSEEEKNKQEEADIKIQDVLKGFFFNDSPDISQKYEKPEKLSQEDNPFNGKNTLLLLDLDETLTYSVFLSSGEESKRKFPLHNKPLFKTINLVLASGGKVAIISHCSSQDHPPAKFMKKLLEKYPSDVAYVTLTELKNYLLESKVVDSEEEFRLNKIKFMTNYAKGSQNNFMVKLAMTELYKNNKNNIKKIDLVLCYGDQVSDLNMLNHAASIINNDQCDYKGVLYVNYKTISSIQNPKEIDKKSAKPVLKYNPGIKKCFVYIRCINSREQMYLGPLVEKTNVRKKYFAGKISAIGKNYFAVKRLSLAGKISAADIMKKRRISGSSLHNR